MNSNPTVARVHVLLARAAPYAVIIRRGPAKHVCTVGWDRKNDKFEVGQWFNGRIYENRADLSPDGRHLIYFAANFQLHLPTRGTWTAISRAPYLKAVSIWGKGDTWFGGGLFLDNTTVLLHGHHDAPLALSPDFRILEDARSWSGRPRQPGSISPTGAEQVATLRPYLSPAEDAIYEASVSKGSENYRNPELYRTFEQYRAGWRLDAHGKECPRGPWLGRHVTRDWRLYRPVDGAGYRLVRRGRGAVVDLPAGTTWADADNWGNAEQLPQISRVIWVDAGRLFAAQVTRKGMGPGEMLFDFNPLTFERLKAPY